MELITSRENDRIKAAAKLMQSAASARESGLFVAEGPKLCREASACGLRLQCVYITDDCLSRHPELADIAPETVRISGSVADRLSGTRSTTGVFAVCRFPQQLPEKPDPSCRYLALEDVQDPANVGAVMRSAAAFGYSGVLLTSGCADPFGQKALRASMGAAFKIPSRSVDDLTGMLRKAASNGMDTVASALRGASDLREYAYRGGGLVLVIGNEGNGLRNETIEACRHCVKIPISGMESLNAAAAACVLMWELGGRQNG